ncbi:MAG: DUF2782 domain-containing protein [Pseudomonadota bacterium]
MYRAIATAGLAMVLSHAPVSGAQELTPIDQVEPPPPVVSGEQFEPDVTIRRGPDRTIHEYRVGGELRAIRVKPDNGPAYYLVDSDGDGRLESSTHIYGPGFWVNSWVLFSW